MRRHLTFPCAGLKLVGSMDVPADTVRAGLLIVSGGNEPRCGPHASMARLAAILAARGIVVLRFDRRGVGDSEGDNAGYRASADDIGAARSVLRDHLPAGAPMAAFGNCDAATALALDDGTRFDAMVLANPWTLDDDDTDPSDDAVPALPPAAAIRARYRARLRDPATIGRALRGGIDWRRLASGLWALRPRRSSPADEPGTLAARIVASIRAQPCPVTILIAARDRTAQHFLADCASGLPASVTLTTRDTASHGFAGPGDAAWLADTIESAIEAAIRAR